MGGERKNIIDGYVICETCGCQQCGYGPTEEVVVRELLRNHFGPLVRCPRLKGTLKLFTDNWTVKLLERPFDECSEDYHAEREDQAAK